jgi:hypothetical protein
MRGWYRRRSHLHGTGAGMEPPSGPRLAAGPDLWRNWKAFAEGQPYQGGFESVLYTDAHLVGEPDGPMGPYRLFNALGRDPFARPGELGVGVVVRVAWHIPMEPSVDPNGPERPKKSSTDHWVGLPLADQLACLLSLVLGARLRSGGDIRNYSPDAGADPGGYPVFHMSRPPTLTSPRRTSVIPDIAGGQVDLSESVHLVRLYAELEADTATVVLRAARLYRQALWIADEDCELAWLLMVSAIETAAAHWHRKGEAPPMVLADRYPELAELLLRAGGQDLLDKASTHIVLNRPTAATQGFLLTFGSAPSIDKRPEAWSRFDFDNLKRAVQQIYAYRSQVLHSGLPFPAPLLEAPWKGDMAAYAETPQGLWTQHGPHTTWMAKDTPMLFHTFAGLCRRALVAWWETLGGGPSAAEQVPRIRPDSPI